MPRPGLREYNVTVHEPDGHWRTTTLWVDGSGDSPSSVMGDVELVMGIAGIDWSDLAKILIPLAFRLLCRAAFR